MKGFLIAVLVCSGTKHLTQTERYLPPVDDLISDQKVQEKFYAEKKRNRIRKTKIKQDKIIDNMRCGWSFSCLFAVSV